MEDLKLGKVQKFDIEDSIIEKYNLVAGMVSPFTRLTVVDMNLPNDEIDIQKISKGEEVDIIKIARDDEIDIIKIARDDEIDIIKIARDDEIDIVKISSKKNDDSDIDIIKIAKKQ